MKEVGQHPGLIPKDFAALQADPLGAIGHHMDATLQSPAGVLGAMPPALTDLRDRSEGGAVVDPGATVGLRGHQAHFLPLPRAWLSADASRFERADHRPIRLGDEARGAFGWQAAKALRIVRLQLLGGARRLLQGDGAHRRSIQAKTIMFLEARATSGKGMLHTKVAEHPLQRA